MQRGFITIPILILIILSTTIIGGGGYYAVKEFSSHSSVTPTTSKESVPDITTPSTTTTEILKTESVTTTNESFKEDNTQKIKNDAEPPKINQNDTIQVNNPPLQVPQPIVTKDVCLNIAGIQTEVPKDYKLNNDICTLIEDICSNIDGVQETVPENMIRDKKYGCMTEKELDEAIEEANQPTPAEIENACKKASDLKLAPTETKIAYISEVTGSPVIASWAPDTTKELLDYMYGYKDHCMDLYERFGEGCSYGHSPDYHMAQVEKYIPILEDRLDDYEEYQQICSQ